MVFASLDIPLRQALQQRVAVLGRPQRQQAGQHDGAPPQLLPTRPQLLVIYHAGTIVCVAHYCQVPNPRAERPEARDARTDRSYVSRKNGAR